MNKYYSEKEPLRNTAIRSIFDGKSQVYYSHSACDLFMTTIHPEDPEHFYISSFFSPDLSFNNALTYEEAKNQVFHSGLHRHDFFELLYVVRGELFQNIENRRHLYPEGSLCLLNRNIHHQEEFDTDCRVIFLSLSPKFISGMLHDADNFMFQKEKNITDDVMLHFFTEDFKNESVAVREYIDFIPVSPKNGSKKMYNLFDTLLHMFLTPEPGTTYSIKMILLQIFCLLNDRSRYKNVPVRIGTETESLLFLKITECMQETNGRISRSGLQQHLHYNGAYLNRIVMKFTGLSIFGYGMTFCMQQAGALLTSSHTDISLIAESLGFQNRTHFYKKFEDTYGMTPGEYRKLHSSL